MIILKNSYLSIPYDILEMEDLTLSEKVILAEVISLSKTNGYCYASNGFFTKRLKISERTASRAVNTLESKGLILISERCDNKRNICPTEKVLEISGNNIHEKSSKGSDKMSNPHANLSKPLDKMSTYNNKYNNNKNNIYNNKNTNYPNNEASYDIEELMVIR